MANTWHYEKPSDGILRVTIDCADRPVNVFSEAALKELDELLDYVRQESDLKGVIFKSGKSGTFIAGADVSEWKDLDGYDEVHELVRFGQGIFQKLEDLQVPTIALIDGSCLGGGLEFALACRYRIAADNSKTLLAFPEVKLGLIPGWGGTVRASRLVGFIETLPMVMTGKMTNGRQAAKKGLVHDCVPAEALDTVGEQLIQRLQSGQKIKDRSRKKPWWKWALENSAPYRALACTLAKRQVMAKTHGHYPAPLAGLEVLKKGQRSREAGFAAEADAVAKLAGHHVTKECVRLFFLSTEAKKVKAGDGAVEAARVKNGAVIGAGAMGAGIALLMAKKGIWTRLKDIGPEQVAAGMQTLRKLVHKDRKRKRITSVQAIDILDHVSPCTDYNGLKHADVIIEAIVENLDIKRKVFADLAAASNEKTVLATNTSSLLVADIAKEVPHPERVVGLHFFNPPHQMPLVEIIRTPQTSDEALATAIALVKKLNKTIVVAGDCPGFLVNRLLTPYMNEAGHLMAELANPLEIERAAIEFGMPMGPLELTDLVGADVAAHVADNLHEAYGERMKPASLWKALKAQRQRLGNKDVKLLQKRFGRQKLNPIVQQVIGQNRRDHRISTVRLSRPEIVERLVYPMINEAARALDEGIAASAEDIDLAMVFGTGFAPFRGGPLHYANSVGLDNIVATLEQLAQVHPRMEPSAALRRFALQGNKFPEPLLEEMTKAA